MTHTKLGEEFVQKSVIRYLSKDNWGKNLRDKGLREHGVDIKVRHNKFARYFLIEAKGDGNGQTPSSQREVNFNYALGQIVTRMHTNKKKIYKYGYKYGVAYPESFKDLVIRRLPYDVCNKLNLYVFLVNEKGIVVRYDWKMLKQEQTKNVRLLHMEHNLQKSRNKE